jgi:hypothetical protein
MTQCCHQCFLDEFVTGKIVSEGTTQECSICGEHRKCLDIEILGKLFHPLVSLYTNVEQFLPMQTLKDQAGQHSTLAEKISADWSIFDDDAKAERFLGLCHDIFYQRDDPDDTFNPMRAVEVEDLFFFGEYERTYLLSTMWAELRRELQEQNRYFAGRGIVSDIEDALRSDLIRITLRQDTLYRVRATTTDDALKKEEMGAPPANRSTAGRANPAGIPYLYLASDQETAICEVRPHNNEKLTVGSFRLATSVTCIDLRDPRIGSPFQHGSKLRDVVGVLGFLRHLGHELSLPIGNQRRDLDYLPTQYLCELIKNLGYDGVLYRSGLSDGYNIALFSPNAAYCFETRLVCVQNIKITVADFVAD